MPVTPMIATLLAGVLVAGCASDPSDAVPTTLRAPASAAASGASPSTDAPPSTDVSLITVVPTTVVPTTVVPTTVVPTTVVPTTDVPTTDEPTPDVPTTAAAQPEVTIPAGILAAMPFQNRLDVAQGIFQVKLYNGTADDLDIVAVQLVWAGLTTPVSHRENRLVAGDRLDYPVPLAAASCVGDGSAASTPDPQDGVVQVSLRDGKVIDVPVFDAKHFAERLYLDDCERQHIESEVGIEWADLHEVVLDGRPVTEGVLRITRRAATTTLAVRGIRNTINFRFELIDGHSGDVAVLAADETSLDVPVRFVEGRCDAHARSESSQPFAFVAELELDLGDGAQRFLVVTPSLADQVPRRQRVDHACDLLGTSGFAGQGDSSTTTTTP